MMLPLGGKTALVTDASRGIGRASALALAQAGAQVLVHNCRDDDAADKVVTAIREAGGHAQSVATDLRAPDGPHRLARRVRLIIGARLDVLVAGAGVVRDASIEDTSIADFDELFALNVRAPYFLVQQLMPSMCTGSSVVLVSSLPACASIGQWSAYAATRGAIDTVVKHFALALGSRGIRVNAVASNVLAPGITVLPNTGCGTETEPGMQALERSAQPDEVGAIVAFLASNAARWITGETIYAHDGSRI
jgi:NAD(P)-dependent dehydrogenase (short-subunit alcohol dehydrogenase family)